MVTLHDFVTCSTSLYIHRFVISQVYETQYLNLSDTYYINIAMLE